jgi:Zn-dependent metalloprotease
MGHELTHGVTAATAGLEYQDQPGALNESISDVFGSLVKQRFLNQTADQADWLIGAGLWTSNVNGVALRSMKAPGTAYDDPVMGKDPQPDNMSGYLNTSDDNGGVHTNSGIPNKAFYLAAVAIGGNAWEVAGNIWYRTLLDSRLTATAQFQDFANLTADIANTLYGATVQSAFVQAWHDVGIDINAGWSTNKLITGLCTIDQDRNACAYVDGDGWKRIAYDNDNVYYNMLSQLISAKGSGSTVNLNISNDTIIQVFVNA